jgi:hypothetical protein
MPAPRRTGATAAAVLPAALAGALLVSAPFAGTTTAPLAKSTDRAAVAPVAAGAGQAPGRATANAHSADQGLRFNVSPGSLAVLGGAELLLLGVGAGVIVAARRRRFADD